MQRPWSRTDGVTRRRGIGPAILLLGAAAALLVGCGSEDDAGQSASTETTEATTSTASPSTEGSSTTAEPVPGEVVWPPAGSEASYDDATEAARAFAVELVGFVEPVVGGLVERETGAGTVEVQPSEDGPVTTVLVRQLDAGVWSVTGALTETIAVTSPETGGAVSDPLRVEGESTAFEGTVQVAVRDQSAEPVGSGFVTGGANGEMGPFAGEIAIDVGDAAGGTVALYTLSMEDGGGVLAATVLPVVFG